MVASVLAALAVAAALWVGWADSGARLKRRLARDRPPRRRPVRRPGGGLIMAGLAVAAAMAAIAAGTAGGWGAALPVAALIVALAAADLRTRGRGHRRAAQTAAEVVRAGEGLAGLLRTGAIPASALVILAVDHPVLAEAAAAQEVGADPAAALRRCAEGPGRAGLAELAAAWEVSARTGASLGAAVEAIADELARRQDVESTVAVELAASRAAGRLMALLPGVGVVLGYALGGDPLEFLLGSPAGGVCLVTATALAAAGLIWTDRLAERARC